VRTTVNLDDDVLLAVQERARRERRSVGEVLSELARQALTGAIPVQREAAGRHGFHPLPPRGRPVSNALIDQLREDDSE
jgi:plasmid stability protein